MKKLFIILCITVSVLNSCTKDSSSNGGNNPPTSSTTKYKIGDVGPTEGIIVQIDSSVTPRKYYEVYLIGEYQWGCPISIGFTNCTPYDCPNGFQNTIDIVSAGCLNSNYAAKACKDYRRGGFDTWYLPSMFELGYVYRTKIYSQMTNFFWCSNQASSTFAYATRMHGSDPVRSLPKTSMCNVIAMRKF